MTAATTISDLAMVVEDDSNTADALARALGRIGFDTVVAGSVRTARLAVARRVPSVVLIDVGLPDGSGLELMKELRSTTSAQCVVVTGSDSRDIVLESLRAHADDFLHKPVSLADIRSSVKRMINTPYPFDDREHQSKPAVDEVVASESANSAISPLVLTGRSRQALALRSQVNELAQGDQHTLIYGELGLEKRSIAEAIHCRSNRTGAFQHEDLADPKHRLDDPANFEHRLSDWIANSVNGTLVLANLGASTLDQQHLLQTKMAEVQSVSTQGFADPTTKKPRIVCILNGRPEKEIAEKRLLPELYYSLCPQSIRVPPLSERQKDIGPMASSIVERLNKQYGRQKMLCEASFKMLEEFSWPGNLLDLSNVVSQGFCSNLSLIRLDKTTMRSVYGSQEQRACVEQLVGKTFWEIEKSLLFATLDFHQGDKKATADTLGISLKTLYNRINAYT